MPETKPPASASRAEGSEEAAHDILAAEAFAVPAPDPTLHHGPIVVPEDPTGIAEPHDILAAEEFPMPAPRDPVPRSGVLRPEKASHRVGIAAAAGLLTLLARRLLRRSR
jgi:hypothetical protein